MKFSPAIFVVVLATLTAQAYGICQGGIDLIKEAEGKKLCVYGDPINIKTIGYGHKCQGATDPLCKPGNCLTETEAEDLLISDIANFETCVKKQLSPHQFGENQIAALVSFAFNLGCGAFKESTMLKRFLNAENPVTVASEELPKWNKAGGQVLPGLVTRRANEVDLFAARGKYINQCGSVVGNTCAVQKKWGVCKDSRVSSCAGGQFVAGFCPGPANIQCCV